MQIQTPAAKGGNKELVLLWDNGDAGKYVQILKQGENLKFKYWKCFKSD